jgi:hypothetical protein
MFLPDTMPEFFEFEFLFVYILMSDLLFYF